jgi:metal-sulfur cluster biosynthetic enzyme
MTGEAHEGHSAMISTRDVETALDTIIDPCAAAVGAPAGLVSMGMVSHIEIGRQGAKLRVEIMTTHAFCMMAGAFVQQAHEVLARLPGVEEVEVGLDSKTIWTPDRQAPSLRERVRALATTKSAGA